MQYRLSLYFVTLLAALLSIDAVAQSRSLSMPTGIAATQGEEVDVPISISNTEGITSYSFTISFDSAVLEFVDAFPGGATSSWGSPDATGLSNSVEVGSDGPELGGGSGELLVLRFRVLSDAPSGESFVRFTGASIPGINRTLRDGSVIVGAISQQDQFTITTSVTGSGTISPSGTVRVNRGANQTFTITPAAGFYVADVRVDNVSQGSIRTFTFENVTRNHAIAVVFSNASVSINVSVEGFGSVSPPGPIVNVAGGSTTTFRFTPGPGSEVKDVIVDGSSKGEVDTYAFEGLTKNATLRVKFGTTSHVITTKITGQGTISPPGPVEVLDFGSQLFNIAPQLGWVIGDVKVNGQSKGAISQVAMSMIRDDQELAVEFRSAGGGGGGISCPGCEDETAEKVLGDLFIFGASAAVLLAMRARRVI